VASISQLAAKNLATKDVGLLGAVGGAIGERFKTRATKIRESFRPENIVKSLTGSDLLATYTAKKLGRDPTQLRKISGIKPEATKGIVGSEPILLKIADNTQKTNDLLIKLVKFYEKQSAKDDIAQNFEEEKATEEELRWKSLIEAVRGTKLQKVGPASNVDKSGGSINFPDIIPPSSGLIRMLRSLSMFLIKRLPIIGPLIALGTAAKMMVENFKKTKENPWDESTWNTPYRRMIRNPEAPKPGSSTDRQQLAQDSASEEEKNQEIKILAEDYVKAFDAGKSDEANTVGNEAFVPLSKRKAVREYIDKVLNRPGAADSLSDQPFQPTQPPEIPPSETELNDANTPFLGYSRKNIKKPSTVTPAPTAPPTAPATSTAEPLSFTQRKEGFAAQAYPDARGQSIGYGHHLTPDEQKTGKIILPDGREIDWKKGISREDANALYQADMAKHSSEMAKKLARMGVDVSKLSSGTVSALEDLAYNAGPDIFSKAPKLVAALKTGDVDKIAQELRTTATTSQGVKMAGLQTRANERAAMVTEPSQAGMMLASATAANVDAGRQLTSGGSTVVNAPTVNNIQQAQNVVPTPGMRNDDSTYNRLQASILAPVMA
jgi:GH24 family phage-related lysozyme (muramidase)